MSVIEDTIRWAEAHGYDVPGFEPNGMSTVEATIREIQRAEQAFLAAVPALVQARAQGVLTSLDRTRYTNARRDLFLSQVDLYNQLTSNRVVMLLRQLGGSAAIPYPIMAPSVDALLGAPAASLSGLGALPAAPIAGVSWAAGVAAVVAVGFAIAITATAISAAFEARINSQSHTRDLEARLSVYQECIDGGASAQDCARVAQGLVPLTPPGSTTPAWITNLQTAAKWTAAAAVLGGLGYVALRFYSARASAHGSRLSGLGGGGKPRKLTSLDDDYPSRYFLEI